MPPPNSPPNEDVRLSSLSYEEGMADAFTKAAEELRQGYTCLSGEGGANCPHSDEFDCAAEVIEDLAARTLRPADLPQKRSQVSTTSPTSSTLTGDGKGQ